MASRKKAERQNEPSTAAVRAVAVVVARRRIRALFPSWTDEQVKTAACERWRDYRVKEGAEDADADV